MRNMADRSRVELTFIGIGAACVLLVVLYSAVRQTADATPLVILDTPPAGCRPVYRFWSPKFEGHFYTISETEKDHIVRTWPGTWTYEGIAFYAWPAPPIVEGDQP